MAETKINMLKPISDILSGNFFGKDFVQKNIGFIVYLTFLVMIYIAYGYYAESQRLEAAKLENMVELNSKRNSIIKELNQISLQSSIIELTKGNGLEELKEAPIVIKNEK